MHGHIGYVYANMYTQALTYIPFTYRCIVLQILQLKPILHFTEAHGSVKKKAFFSPSWIRHHSKCSWHSAVITMGDREAS